MRTILQISAICLSISVLSLCVGCGTDSSTSHPPGTTLKQGRVGFVTQLTSQKRNSDPVPAPPPGEFDLVQYTAPLGTYPAYVTVPPSLTGKYPAIIWLPGGFTNSISGALWAPPTVNNDQSSKAFRKFRIITMYPSLRGGNGNAGSIEGFYGEVDDVIAARNFLAALPYVDPQRIYLAGYSTGGTLALLVGESTDQFRGIFAFGPADDMASYGQQDLPFDAGNEQELDVRAPILWLDAIKTRTYIIEGVDPPGNMDQFNRLQAASKNPLISFFAVPGFTHFTEVAQTVPIVAQKIAGDDGRMTLSTAELTVPTQTVRQISPQPVQQAAPQAAPIQDPHP